MKRLMNGHIIAREKHNINELEHELHDLIGKKMHRRIA